MCTRARACRGVCVRHFTTRRSPEAVPQYDRRLSGNLQRRGPQGPLQGPRALPASSRSLCVRERKTGSWCQHRDKAPTRTRRRRRRRRRAGVSNHQASERHAPRSTKLLSLSLFRERERENCPFRNARGNNRGGSARARAETGVPRDVLWHGCVEGQAERGVLSLSFSLIRTTRPHTRRRRMPAGCRARAPRTSSTRPPSLSSASARRERPHHHAHACACARACARAHTNPSHAQTQTSSSFTPPRLGR